MLNVTRRHFLSTTAMAFAAESEQSVKSALVQHNRAVWVKDGWVRDPYIVLAPDGFYYYTGTTQPPGQAEEVYNTGLGPKSKVGWHVQAWRSRNLYQWESLGAIFSLTEGYWAQAAKAKFDSTPKSEWRLWAPALHWMDGRWAVIHTSPSPHRSSNFSLTAGSDLKGPWTHPMGASIGQRHGRYVLFGTGWSTGKMRKGSYNLYYALADKITGPYSERKFAGRFLGHGTPFQDKEHRWWCTAFYNANVPPTPDLGIQKRDLSDDAQTINQQGLTLVPLDVKRVKGDLIIRAKDARYAHPGPDEAQKF